MIEQDRNFQMLGVSHSHVSLPQREKLSFYEGSSKEFLKTLRDIHGLMEALILSTCNRTEIYFHGDEDDRLRIKAQLKIHKQVDDEILDQMRLYMGDEAVNHLFRVSLGLDSKILGDIQIINQVKKAYQWSADQGMAGPFLHRLMHTIFYANKRVTQETNFRDGSGSIASVVVDIIRNSKELIRDPKILILGIGKIGRNVLENLGEEFTDITIINRTTERAKTLATELGKRFSPIDRLTDEVNKADVIIASVSAENPLIRVSDVRPSLSPRVFIDLSIPRAVESDVENVQGAMIYNLDGIEERASEVLTRRKGAVNKVEKILLDHFLEFREWSDEMLVSPTIQQLKEKLEQIRREEVARHLKRLSENEVKLLEEVTRNMIQKVIKLPVLELKAACKRGEAETLVGALNGIFNLEETVKNKN